MSLHFYCLAPSGPHAICLAATLVLAIAFSGGRVAAQSGSLLNDTPPVARPLRPLQQRAISSASGARLGYPSMPSPEATFDGNSQVPESYSEGEPRTYLNGVSWTFQPAPPVRTFRINDIVTIRVDEITRVIAEGGVESRKRTLFQTIVRDWIRFDKWAIKPDPQTEGDPAVASESNNLFRSESTVESRESMAFSIAAHIVDIRANGNLVLEARKSIRLNDNLWETSLIGICRPEDIAPDNVVLSRDLIDLEIRKEDRGHLRDGYKRGWLTRWLDRLQPF
jgi:flagellar L-ring protein precursor FlgH